MGEGLQGLEGSRWQEIQSRYEAWWQGEMLDRVLIAIQAPRKSLPEPVIASEDELQRYWTDPDTVLAREEERVAATYYCGDAFPCIVPVRTGMVAILALFLGAPGRFVDTRTVWSEPIIEDWATRPTLRFDPENLWWQIAQRLLAEGAKRAVGKYCVAIPDLNGPGEILARLRGPDRLAIDLLENPEQIPPALAEINQAWFRYFEACHGIVHQYVPGYVNWMGLWSQLPATDLQTDFSIMISEQMFERFFLPFIEEQTRLVPRNVYHLDGPGAARHLDLLLDLPGLGAIQWVPGAGAPPVSAWLPLLRRVQARGKRLVLHCESWEVPILLEELEPEPLFLSTWCACPEDADALLALATKLSQKRKWLAPLAQSGHS